MVTLLVESVGRKLISRNRNNRNGDVPKIKASAVESKTINVKFTGEPLPFPEKDEYDRVKKKREREKEKEREREREKDLKVGSQVRSCR